MPVVFAESRLMLYLILALNGAVGSIMVNEFHAVL